MTAEYGGNMMEHNRSSGGIPGGGGPVRDIFFLARGLDVDMPRNLAKRVTAEQTGGERS